MSRASQPSLDIDVTRARLERLGLVRACEQLEVLLVDAVKAELAPHRFLDQVLESELAWREDRRVRTSLRLSGLPTGQTIGSFDFSFQPSIERSRIETLGTCQWIRENRTLLIQGPPGVGKTHLAIALAVRAVECGFGVSFYRLDELMAALRRDSELSPSRLRRKKYLSASLLVIDESASTR